MALEPDIFSILAGIALAAIFVAILVFVVSFAWNVYQDIQQQKAEQLDEETFADLWGDEPPKKDRD